MNDWRSFDEVAETYERIHAPRLGRVARDLIAASQPPQGGRLLDVGAGTGVGVAAAGDAVGPTGIAVGIDRSIPMILAGRRSRPLPRLVATQALDLPFRDGTFDRVTGNFVVGLFPKAETALFEMIRVLKYDGRIALSSWGEGEDDLEKTWRSLLLEVVQEELLDDVERRAAPGRERFSRRADIEEVLINAGLRHVRTEAREYRFQYTVEEFVLGRAAWATGRFVREMLGPERFQEFLDRARSVYSERFADPLNDFRDVWFALGTRALGS
jgi:ubiquinone/menaquinone biosynthesis C-methylase UbiE